MNNNIRFVLKSCDGIPSAAEARQLSRDYKAGDQAARQRLITGNMPLINKLLQRFRVPPRLMDDAFEEGVLGLMRAAEEHDPEHPSGAAFSTTAYWWVMHYVRKFMQREIRKHEHETPIGCDIRVAAEELDIDITFDQDFTNNPDAETLLGGLNRRERLAMTSVTYSVPMSELAAEMGVSKQRVQQIKAGALDKLRGMVR